MENENKGKNALALALSMLFTILTVVGFYLSGFFLAENLPALLFHIGFPITACLMVANIIFNVVYKICERKKRQGMTVREMNELFLRKKADVKASLEDATLRLLRVERFSKGYLFLSALILAFTLFFWGGVVRSAQLSDSTTPVVVVALVYLEIYRSLFKVLLDRFKVDPEKYLSREKFPELYRVAEEARDAVGATDEIYIATENSFVGAIVKEKKCTILLLGTVLVNCLSREELYNVLLHEFAHYSTKYSPKKIDRFFCNFVRDSADSAFWFTYPMVRYIKEYAMYDFVASEFIESMADTIVKEEGNPKRFASAIAKCCFYESYEKISHLYRQTFILDSETVPEDIAQRVLSAYREAVSEHREHWLALYEKEIQPRSATHPIYRSRRDAVGVSAQEVEICLSFEDELSVERESLLAYASEKIVEGIAEEYNDYRKENYLAPLKVVEDWEADKASYTSADLIPVIQALMALYRHEEAETLCDEIIANETNIHATAYPKYIKASMMLLRDEDEGIDMLYEVIDLNDNAVADCLNEIGEYACTHGLQEVLDVYREKAMFYAQREIDERDETGVLDKGDTVIESRLAEEKREAHTKFISSVSEKIKRVYLVEKVINENFSTHAYLVEFDPDTTEEMVDESMSKIFRYLDTVDGEQYSLFLYGDNYKAIVKRVQNAIQYEKSEQ